MSEFTCAIEDAGRRGTKRCAKECESCRQNFLKLDDGRVDATCETAGGRYFDYADPRATTVTLDDVAHHLAVNCRFGGAVSDSRGRPVLYSVAEHAIRVCDLVLEWGHPELALAALHHDSAEYMLGDWPTPLKRLLRAQGVTLLDRLADRADAAIGERFGVDHALFHNVVVKQADTTLLYREAATYKTSKGVGSHWGRTEVSEPLSEKPLRPWVAKEAFIAKHYSLGGK